MSKTNSIVEVNGSRYDAVTGSLLTPRKISLPTPGKVIDGITKTKTHAKAHQPQPKAQKLHRTPQRSTTLMRQIVKRPTALKADIVNPKAAQHHPHTHPVRAARAKTVEKHNKVNRFGFLPAAPTATKESFTKVKMTAKASYRDGSTAATSPRLPSMVSSVSHRKLEEMLDEALLRADAHKQMMNRHGRRIGRVPRWLGFSIGAVAILAIVFWIIWQNLPTVAMRVAAARAHVSASLPNYTPSGYNIAGPIKYKDGAVTMSFKNDSKQYSITQKASSWNSTALQDNKLASDSAQTSMVNGTTVYLYGANNDAAWIDHGIMYTLKNDSRLSSDQIFKIVQGL